MARSRVVMFLAAACWCVGSLAATHAARAVDSAALEALFADPPRQYSPSPLWVWNDMLTDDEIRGTLRDLAGQQVKQAFVHPRPGLMTPYLSDEWFRLWKVALDEAQRLDMNLWIYDEDSYPSGFAGGLVPEAMPESRGCGLAVRESKHVGAIGPEVLSVIAATGRDFRDVTQQARAGEKLPEGRYLVVSVQGGPRRAFLAGGPYVDLLRPGVTEKFIEHWGKPCYNYCRKHGLEFTGHYWEHGWPNASHGPDNMAMYAWQQRPGIDILMNQYSLEVGAQFGNARSVRELASVANQLGRKRTLCEAYGAGGWDLRFEDMKRIGDWLYVLGVNTLDEHLSYITIRGTRKRDHPQSFSYHEPWWGAYHVLSRYFTRLSAALSAGEQVNRILVIEPTTTAWMYQPGKAAAADHLATLGQAFQDLVHALERAQVEYDLGCEELIGRFGSVKRDELVIGRRAYHTVVLPPLTENLNGKTIDLLQAYLKAGGRVLSCGPPPDRVDGSRSDRGETMAQGCGWNQVEPGAVPAILSALAPDGFAIRRDDLDRGILFHHRRQLDDGRLLFLVNTSIEAPSRGVVESRLAGAERWDPETGRVRPYPFTTTASGIALRFELPPCGSLLLFLSEGPRQPGPPPVGAETIRPLGPPKIRRLEPNVLVLDFLDVTAGTDKTAAGIAPPADEDPLDVTAGGATRPNVYCRSAGYFAFQRNGMLRNPWDHAVQFRDAWIRHEFPPESFVEATYRFAIEGRVPEPLDVVVERPDLYEVTVNGKPAAAPKGAWGIAAFVGVFVLVLVWLVLMPRRLLDDDGARAPWWRNVRFWAAVVALVQIAVYLCWG